MILKGIIDEDHINYKKLSMVIEFPYCSFKCDKECGKQVCQNGILANSPNIEIPMDRIVERYLNNPLTEAVVLQGLEPFDSKDDLFELIKKFREITQDDIVIYTGYTKCELNQIFGNCLRDYRNIIIKYGRYIPYDEPHYDNVLGVTLASNNQYAERL